MNSSGASKLHELNHTELYQMCRRAGINVHPSTTISELIAYLAGDADPPELSEAEHPIDSWRHGIIGFINDHWKTLEAQLKCPAKQLRHPQNPDPRPCFRCTDAQVITCVVNNPGRKEHLINLHRPTKGTTR